MEFLEHRDSGRTPLRSALTLHAAAVDRTVASLAILNAGVRATGRVADTDLRSRLTRAVTACQSLLCLLRSRSVRNATNDGAPND